MEERAFKLTNISVENDDSLASVHEEIAFDKFELAKIYSIWMTDII